MINKNGYLIYKTSNGEYFVCKILFSISKELDFRDEAMSSDR